MVEAAREGTRDQIRDLSKLLFGNRLRLEIAGVVADAQGEVYARMLAAQLGVNDNQVAPELKNLEQAGLLIRVVVGEGEEPGRGRPAVLYRRVPSAYWDLARGLLEEADAGALSETPITDRGAGFDEVAADQPATIDNSANVRASSDHTSLRELVLGRYRLERKLGAGGFGVVWLAVDEKLEREVAVKVIQADRDSPVSVSAAREARIAARLDHPGIVSLYELGEDDEAVYLVSELVPGRTMAELTRAGALSDRDVARIGVALCDALAHAHDRKVVHRDVKPQNVIVLAEPAAGAGFAKLANFGVAQLAIGEPLTRTGDVVGTMAYMPPEQAEGGRVTPAADIYSLALTLYESWTGVNPARGPTPAATVRRLGRRLPLLSAYRPDLPTDMCAWIDAALDPMPTCRPNLRDLHAALLREAGELEDRAGLAAPETQERVGLMSAPRRKRRVRLGRRWLAPAAQERRPTLDATSWLPARELSFSDWTEHGRKLGISGPGAGWWIGDWLRYGNVKWGERYARAARITGYDVQTLMNLVYIASAYEPEQRRSKLSWSHHAEVASLPADERDRWLDLAETNRLSVRCLREELRRST